MISTVTGLNFSIELALWIPIALIAAIIIYNLVTNRRDK